MCRRTTIKNRIAKNFVCTQVSELSTPCHIWMGSTSGNGRGGGYPRMSLNGQTVAVHIVVWTNEHGYIPGKKQIDHLCENRLCVNVEHLEMVSHIENQKRKKRKTHGKEILSQDTTSENC